MLRDFTILFFAVIIAVTGASAQKTADKTADETVIRERVGQLMKGWNAKSGAEFAKPFAEDADYVVINGMQIKGRVVIAKAHQNIFETIYKNSNLSLSAETIRFLRPDVAVVHVAGSMKIVEGETERISSRARMTLVMTKTDGRWEIVAFQNTEVQAVNQTKN